MASITKDTHQPPKSPYWIACFTSPDGRRLKKSTKTTEKKLAQKLADEMGGLRRPVVPDGLPKLKAGKSSPKCMSAQLASLSTSALPVVAPCAPLFLPNPDYKLHHRAPDTAPRIDWLALHE